MKKHNVVWMINHLKVLKALNDDLETNHKIFLETGLTPRTVYEHRKEIVKCLECGFFTTKNENCLYCRSKLNGVLNG